MQEQIVIIGDTYKLYRPRLNQVLVGKVDRSGKDNKVPGNALAFMSMSKAQLEANYTVNYIGQETAAGSLTWHLELLPKTKTSYKSAELWIDANGMPIQAKIIESTTTRQPSCSRTSKKTSPSAPATLTSPSPKA